MLFLSLYSVCSGDSDKIHRYKFWYISNVTLHLQGCDEIKTELGFIVSFFKSISFFFNHLYLCVYFIHLFHPYSSC